MEKEPFDNDLNVSRQELLDEIELWLHDQHPEYRLRSIVGTAGIGKSWFMADLYRILREDTRFHVIWLDMSEPAIDPFDKERVLPDCRTEDGRCAWLQNIAQDSTALYTSNTYTFQSDAPFIPNFNKFVNMIGQQNPPITVLLVDGYDEVVEPHHQDFLQEHILSRFWGGGNTRILLARRDEDIISHPILSWNDDPLRLRGFEEHQSQEQITLRAEKTSTVQVDPAQITSIFSPYFSVNPFINTYLFDRLITNTPASINQSDVEACARAIIDRAELKDQHLVLIKNIVNTLPAEWVARELSEYLKMSLENELLDQLFKTGVVHQINGTARYRVEEGLHSLLSFLQVPEDYNGKIQY